MSIQSIPIHSILVSGRNTLAGPFEILDGIRQHCRNSDWDGSAWISPFEWVLEHNTETQSVCLRYTGVSSLGPPETARIFYDSDDNHDPATMQRLAYIRLCFWVLSSGLASVEELPVGTGDRPRLEVLKRMLAELSAKCPERVDWAERIYGILTEELEEVKRINATALSQAAEPELCATANGDETPCDVNLVHQPSAASSEPVNQAGRVMDDGREPPADKTRCPGEAAGQGDCSLEDRPVREAYPRAEPGCRDDSVTDPENEAVQSGDCHEVVDPADEAPPEPEWWAYLARRANPWTAPRIPRNARGGQPIEAIDVRLHVGLDGIRDAKLEFIGLQPGFPDSAGGFQFNPDDGVLTGSPNVAGGDYELVFDIPAPDGVKASPVRYLIPVTINPDPQSLWRTLEPPDDSRFRKRNRAGLYRRVADKSITWASVRGRSHAHEGGHRDDDCRIEELVDGWHVVAVADGAGSASCARLGSAVAVEACVNSLREQLDHEEIRQALRNAAETLASQEESERASQARGWEVLPKAAFDAQKAVLDKARELAIEDRALGTTLLAFMTCDIGTKSIVGAFSVGDGIIASIEATSGRSRLLSVPDTGEFAGQTKFLTNREVFLPESRPYSRLRIAVVDRPAMLIGMTDGVSDPKFSSDESMANPLSWRELVTELAAPLREMGSAADDGAAPLQQWLDFWAVGHHDDRTIAICMDQQFLDVYGAG